MFVVKPPWRLHLDWPKLIKCVAPGPLTYIFWKTCSSRQRNPWNNRHNTPTPHSQPPCLTSKKKPPKHIYQLGLINWVLYLYISFLSITVDIFIKALINTSKWHHQTINRSHLEPKVRGLWRTWKMHGTMLSHMAAACLVICRILQENGYKVTSPLAWWDCHHSLPPTRPPGTSTTQDSSLLDKGTPITMGTAHSNYSYQ